jgi:hypothetical protein
VIPTRIFHVDVVTQTYPFTYVITLDKDGDLLELEIKTQMGNMTFSRVK